MAVLCIKATKRNKIAHFDPMPPNWCYNERMPIQACIPKDLHMTSQITDKTEQTQTAEHSNAKELQKSLTTKELIEVLGGDHIFVAENVEDFSKRVSYNCLMFIYLNPVNFRSCIVNCLELDPKDLLLSPAFLQSLLIFWESNAFDKGFKNILKECGWYPYLQAAVFTMAGFSVRNCLNFEVPDTQNIKLQNTSGALSKEYGKTGLIITALNGADNIPLLKPKN